MHHKSEPATLGHFINVTRRENFQYPRAQAQRQQTGSQDPNAGSREKSALDPVYKRSHDDEAQRKENHYRLTVRKITASNRFIRPKKHEGRSDAEIKEQLSS